jgi:hypothetical protein
MRIFYLCNFPYCREVAKKEYCVNKFSDNVKLYESTMYSILDS